MLGPDFNMANYICMYYQIRTATNLKHANDANHPALKVFNLKSESVTRHFNIHGWTV